MIVIPAGAGNPVNGSALNGSTPYFWVTTDHNLVWQLRGAFEVSQCGAAVPT